MDQVSVVVIWTARASDPVCASSRLRGVVPCALRVRTPCHSRIQGLGSGSSVESRKYVSTPYGGCTRNEPYGTTAISEGGGPGREKRGSDGALPGNRCAAVTGGRMWSRRM